MTFLKQGSNESRHLSIMNGWEIAKQRLQTGQYTCVICKSGTVYTATDRGVKPLVRWYETDNDFVDAACADKVVGKATAFLYVLLGVSAVYAKVISKPALSVLCEHDIEVDYDTLVDHIINRRGDGICPFEVAVADIRDPATAYRRIREKMTELHIE